MPDSWLSQCWDSSVLIPFLTEKEPERLPVIRELIELFENGDIHVVISTALIAELRPYQESDNLAGKRPRTHTLQFESDHISVVNAILENERLDIRPLTAGI